ncbi:MAG: PAS domain S-box protein, partial [Verrucomicrobia bacterium]|nr:PAS domain S-box protein [Verrucomicrobiota bacterium]
RINPSQYFFPLIQSWPTSSWTAETLLVRREGDDVVYLNELRHRKGTAMNLRTPGSAKNLPAAMAVRGEVGLVEGVDYRSVPVVAVLRPVPDTPWFMVAKADRQEVYAPLHQQAWAVAVNMGFMALASYLGVALLLRRRELILERERKIAAERLAHLMRHANDMILLADAAGRIVEANDRALETHGLSLAEMRQMTLENLRTPASRANYGRDCKRMTTHGGALFEAEHQRKDGTFFPAEISARLVQIGGVTYQLNIIRDITKRRKAEKALRESEEKFRSLFDHSADAVFVEDSGGTVLDVNPAACRLHGLKREQLIGRHVRDLVPAEHRERVVRDFPKWFTGELTQYEGFTLTADGRAVPVEIRGAPVSYAGQPALLLHVRDITERRRAEAALRQTEEKYRNIFENAVEGIYQSTPDGRILSANPAMAAIHGYASPDEFIANVNDIARQ